MTSTNINSEKLISRILNGSSEHNDVNDFINLCSSISAAYVKNEIYYNRLYFPIVNEGDNDLKDICIDLIAPLFERDESNSFKIFKQYILTDNNQLSQESPYNRIKSIIISKTKQELIERYKEEEPGGYKILRNIKLAPTRNIKIKKFNDQFNTYYYYSEAEYHNSTIDHLKVDLPEIDQDELLEVVFEACKEDTVIPKILECILIYIQKKETCRDLIEISSLFKTLKKVMLYKTVPLESILEGGGYINNHNGYNYRSEIFQEMELYIDNIINHKYLANNKIINSEAKYYELVLKEYFKDKILAYSSNTLPHYLNNGYNIYITKDNSRLHKTRIEYLVKICKKRLVQIISNY